ncbi:Imm74 family immunity protein [Listeria fleischmannii]|uniref:Imm74 family immunity protein n=1 Tax=Listeria fleischmannii TaxID=1069827 RepID=UPI0016268191|nr:Imm74 family immunity protein [Listeria fleischmannii]MBC1418478.1 hypothetical protein [Listeria fleischmannii]
MKITGSYSSIKFDLENGYVLKADGEMLVGGQFVVYKNSMKRWESPHEEDIVSEQDIQQIITKVEKMSNENTIKLIFE